LFAANQRPAVDVGLSVSRVGGKAQRAALRQLSGRIRLDYAQFLELEMFTRFGGISDTRVRNQIARGESIRALLTQPRFMNLRLVDEVALLAALADGVLDSVPSGRIAAVRARLAAFLDARLHGSDIIPVNGVLDDTARESCVAAVRALLQEVAASVADPDTA
jgi:F-type H+-transporting ATPase subunit alpha